MSLKIAQTPTHIALADPDGCEVVVTPEEAHALALQLLAAVQSATFPALVAGEGETRCPHCGHRTTITDERPAVIEHDHATRANEGYLGFDSSRSVSIGQGQADFETTAFACYECGKYVALPSETFAINWS